MMKRKRELFTIAEREGLQKVSILETSGNHLRVEGFHDGKKVKVIVALSPSCHRSDLNFRGFVRKAIRAIDAQYA
jgi:hypothetical protein